LINTPPPVTGLTFPKGVSKPPFQTREQIERRIAQQKLSAEDQAELWHSLFLTLSEVEEFLNHVRDAKLPAYIYPMVVFAAHSRLIFGLLPEHGIRPWGGGIVRRTGAPVKRNHGLTHNRADTRAPPWSLPASASGEGIQKREGGGRGVVRTR
jgi:hypothetical protein